MPHPKTPADPTFDSNPNVQSIKKQSRKKKPIKVRPNKDEIPDFKGLEMSEQTWAINLPNDVNNDDPCAIFCLFFNEEILLTIVKHTNEYAILKDAKKSTGRPWRAVTLSEIYIYLAILIHIGLESSPSKPVSSYWSLKSVDIKQYISLERYQQIERYFHISEPQKNAPNVTQFDRIQPLSRYLSIVAKQLVTAPTHVTIDESMQRETGRVKDKVRVPSKPIPEGFKLQVLGFCGYVFSWLFHTYKGGPIDLDPKHCRAQDQGLVRKQICGQNPSQHGIENDATQGSNGIENNAAEGTDLTVTKAVIPTLLLTLPTA